SSSIQQARRLRSSSSFSSLSRTQPEVQTGFSIFFKHSQYRSSLCSCFACCFVPGRKGCRQPITRDRSREVFFFRAGCGLQSRPVRCLICALFRSTFFAMIMGIWNWCAIPFPQQYCRSLRRDREGFFTARSLSSVYFWTIACGATGFLDTI